MRDKVLAAFKLYFEGGTIKAAHLAAGLSAQQFYDALHDYPDLDARYRHIRKSRGHGFADEAVGVALDMGTDKGIEFRCAREKAKTFLELAARFNKEDYGDKLAISVEQPPSVIMAIENGKARTLLPSRDLVPLLTAQAIDVECAPVEQTRDTQSREPAKAPILPASSIFDD